MISLLFRHLITTSTYLFPGRVELGVTLKLAVQVKDLLQHRTGPTALAQQGAQGRNAVEVMGLQKVYRASNAR